MKRFVIALTLVALLFGGCSRPAGELKIVSFNIRYNSWNNIDGANGWPPPQGGGGEDDSGGEACRHRPAGGPRRPAGLVFSV